MRRARRQLLTYGALCAAGVLAAAVGSWLAMHRLTLLFVALAAIGLWYGANLLGLAADLAADIRAASRRSPPPRIEDVISRIRTAGWLLAVISFVLAVLDGP
jgi:hypothetical protein